MNQERPLVVVKVGGSLLDWPELPERLQAALAARRSQRIVLIVGGGKVVDVLRELDRIHSFDARISHDLALRAMELNAYCLSALRIGLKVAEHPSALASIWSSGQVPILRPRPFLDEVPRADDPLPQDWCVTSDSIAASISKQLNASELVLLKSAPIAPGAGLEDAVRLGLVDAYFPRAARGLPRITYRNLRDGSCPGHRLA